MSPPPVPDGWTWATASWTAAFKAAKAHKQHQAMIVENRGGRRYEFHARLIIDIDDADRVKGLFNHLALRASLLVRTPHTGHSEAQLWEAAQGAVCLFQRGGELNHLRKLTWPGPGHLLKKEAEGKPWAAFQMDIIRWDEVFAVLGLFQTDEPVPVDR